MSLTDISTLVICDQNDIGRRYGSFFINFSNPDLKILNLQTLWRKSTIVLISVFAFTNLKQIWYWRVELVFHFSF